MNCCKNCSIIERFNLKSCFLTDEVPIIYHWFIVRFPIFGLPLPNISSSAVLMKYIGAEFVQPYALHGVNHIRGMQYEIVLNIAFCSELY